LVEKRKALGYKYNLISNHLAPVLLGVFCLSLKIFLNKDFFLLILYLNKNPAVI
jgi:hypothetical protein